MEEQGCAEEIDYHSIPTCILSCCFSKRDLDHGGEAVILYTSKNSCQCLWHHSLSIYKAKKPSILLSVTLITFLGLPVSTHQVPNTKLAYS